VNELPGRLVLLGHPLIYEALDVPPENLEAVIEGVIAQRVAGNVTIPHKTAVYELTDGRTPVAERAGAVNTFWVRDGKLLGDNTDVAGFDALVRDTVGSVEKGARVALIGAGGAAAAVLTAIEQWPGAHVKVWSRSANRLSSLVARFGELAEAASSVEDALRDATVVVNATPIGMSDDGLPTPLDILPRRARVFDVVYRRGGTAWVNGARSRGHIAADGKVMLLAQGAAAFERWFGIRADARAMRAALE
jgi:shikimate dehydrogenase